MGPYQSVEPNDAFGYSEKLAVMDSLLEAKAAKSMDRNGRVDYANGGAEVFLR